MILNSLGDVAWAADTHACEFRGREASCKVADLARTSALRGRLAEFENRSILLLSDQQLVTAIALLELDGVAARLVLCPPDLSPDQLEFVAATAQADALVQSEGAIIPDLPGLERFVIDDRPSSPVERFAEVRTEWVLLTSGTMGSPKLVSHTIDSLAGTLPRGGASVGTASVWSTFYDIRRYGGLQIYLRAVLSGVPLVLSDSTEPVSAFLERAGREGVTHISGTPSHWRRVLMSPLAPAGFDPCYVRLSGEVADQPVLDGLRAAFPAARVSHAFASTEAGVAFDVEDGLAGFPAMFVQGTESQRPAGVLLKVENGSLQIRSMRNAAGYLGSDPAPLVSDEGFVDTGDLVELVEDRYHFRGRRGGVINVGGQKVYPEEIESVLNADERVSMSLVRARRNPITGSVVVAEVVLTDGNERSGDPGFDGRVTSELLAACRRALPAYKVPVVLKVVPSLEMTAGGKLARQNA